MNEWMQDLFDLMANERVRVTVTGEMGDVDAVLGFPQNRPDLEPWSDVAFGHGTTFEEAMQDMMREYEARLTT